MATGRGRRPTPLPPSARVLTEYAAQVGRADLTAPARRTYLSRVRVFLAWLADADVDGDPLTDPAAAVWAARDNKAYLYGTGKRAPATANAALAAVSDLAIRRGLGKLDGQAVARLDLPARRAPKARAGHFGGGLPGLLQASEAAEPVVDGGQGGCVGGSQAALQPALRDGP
jgi:hypothetical protein